MFVGHQPRRGWRRDGAPTRAEANGAARGSLLVERDLPQRQVDVEMRRALLGMSCCQAVNGQRPRFAARTPRSTITKHRGTPDHLDDISDAFAHAFVLIHDQYACLVDGRAGAAAIHGLRGRATSTVVPAPAEDCTDSLPPWASMIRSEM
jgi:hypothetical protein